MLVLSALHDVLTQVLSLPELHTAVLLTPSGQLISYASDPSSAKDHVRVVVGLSGEVWQETQGVSMVDTEVGRILVMPVEKTSEATPQPRTDSEAPEPLMLIALNAVSSVDWQDLQDTGRELANHLAGPINKYRSRLLASAVSPTASQQPRR
ncbi:hypothetical protein GLOTRDRAFT_134872 [Gloeophyllum trabeum ATCC 11539]|uniref:Roadblock/LAMTOR2 domain-containing protein n=1 Tax=Gloeophyllum trabeum (strain ATCC 11539 / FP-39264 / Madison 617) TaxID=670483 RepID=S7QLB7_GLOTA|nr:uncharacterized protein GLOTRDRAFT_134872 [Gloeophyllum trabeum ATCC 11539]EPQ60123.1 hypothetical protein GLOTRDRAFT_134872 [Gloeophyllum trabeum ATCC 11539]